MRFGVQLAIAAMLGGAVAAQAQTAPPPAPSAQDDDPIVVEGAAADQARLERSIRTGFSTAFYRPDLTSSAFEQSERAARCAAAARLISPALLRGVVDGVFNSPTHDRQQDQLYVQTATCGVGNGAFQRLTTIPPGSGSSTSERGVLLRGAVIIAVLDRYAPDLKLSAKTLRDPAVVRRFTEREEPRARLRVPLDLRYFKVTACLVQRQPEAAIAIVHRPADASDQRLRIARLIDRARDCVGGAERVAFDPIQFRVYLADSLYRWAVAATGVETLVADAPGT